MSERQTSPRLRPGNRPSWSKKRPDIGHLQANAAPHQLTKITAFVGARPSWSQFLIGEGYNFKVTTSRALVIHSCRVLPRAIASETLAVQKKRSNIGHLQANVAPHQLTKITAFVGARPSWSQLLVELIRSKQVTRVRRVLTSKLQFSPAYNCDQDGRSPGRSLG